jgi:hypothetical protein
MLAEAKVPKAELWPIWTDLNRFEPIWTDLNGHTDVNNKSDVMCSSALGVTIVGGSDTPLRCVVVQVW